MSSDRNEFYERLTAMRLQKKKSRENLRRLSMKENERRLSAEMDGDDERRLSLQEKSSSDRRGSTMGSTMTTREEIFAHQRRRSHNMAESFGSIEVIQNQNQSIRQRQSWTVDQSTNTFETKKGQEKSNRTATYNKFYKPTSSLHRDDAKKEKYKLEKAAADRTSNTSGAKARTEDDAILKPSAANPPETIGSLSAKLHNLESRMKNMEEENRKLTIQLNECRERESSMRDEMKTWMKQELHRVNHDLVQENSDLQRQLQDLKSSGCDSKGVPTPVIMHRNKSESSSKTNDTEETSSEC